MSTLSDKFNYFLELEETSGNRTDSVASLVFTDNAAVGSNTGKVGTAAEFDGFDYLSRADEAANRWGDIEASIVAWAYLSSPKDGNRTLVAKWSYGSNNREYMLDYVNSSDRFRFIVSPDGTGSTSVLANNLGSPSTGTWYLIIAWHDPVANKIFIQVNNGTPDEAAHSTGVFSGASTLGIGTLLNGGAGEAFHSGRLDQLGLAKAIFTSDEKTFLYNSGTGRSWADILASGGAVIPVFLRQYRQRWAA